MYQTFNQGQLLSHKRELAWAATRKLAVAQLFGAAHAPLVAPLSPDALQSYILRLVSAALVQGRFAHGLDADDRLEELIHHYGWGERVPYADDFAAAFAHAIAGHDLPQVVEYLFLECLGYEHDYPTFFQAGAGGYQYLHDVLAHARYTGTVADTPSLARAIAWLSAQAAASERIPPLPPSSPPLARPPAPAAAGALPDPLWAGALAGAHTRQHVEAVLLAVGLLAGDGPGQGRATPEARAGEWIGAALALQQFGRLTRNKEAVTRAFRATYGNVFSARALQAGLNADNERQNAAPGVQLVTTGLTGKRKCANGAAAFPLAARRGRRSLCRASPNHPGGPTPCRPPTPLASRECPRRRPASPPGNLPFFR